jgi:hypothetical protein
MPAKPALECGREAAAFLSGGLSNYKIRRPNGGAFPVYTDAITPRNCDSGKGRQLRDRTPRRCAQDQGMTRLEWEGSKCSLRKRELIGNQGRIADRQGGQITCFDSFFESDKICYVN